MTNEIELEDETELEYEAAKRGILNLALDKHQLKDAPPEVAAMIEQGYQEISAEIDSRIATIRTKAQAQMNATDKQPED